MINDIVKVLYACHRNLISSLSISQAGGGSTSSETEDSIGYLDLLKILSQHGLHIKESGLIGRHFKRVSIVYFIVHDSLQNYHRIVKPFN